MARPRWTFRAGRRNLCRKRKGVWPAGGIQLDPHRYNPTKAYAQEVGPTTLKMFKDGVRRLRHKVKAKIMKGGPSDVTG
jgi:hypothetical protein